MSDNLTTAIDVAPLLEQAILTEDGLSLWWAIKEVLTHSTNADDSHLYLYVGPRRQRALRELGSTILKGMELPNGNSGKNRVYQLRRPIEGWYEGEQPTVGTEPEHDAVRAFRTRSVVSVDDALGGDRLYVPILDQGVLASSARPLGVLELRFSADEADSPDGILSILLTSLLPQVLPLCALAQARHRFPVLARVIDADQLNVGELLDRILELICSRLDFSYAMISLVDEKRQVIQATQAKNVDLGWMSSASHPLDSNDIVADVYRSGMAEVFRAESPYDSRFDAKIYDTYGHDRLERIFVPLGKVGVLEAGFEAAPQRYIDAMTKSVLEDWCREVATTIRARQLHERQQRSLQTLIKITKVGHEMHRFPYVGADQQAFLEMLAEQACQVLDADIALLYPAVTQATLHGTSLARVQEPPEFGAPIIKGRRLAGRDRAPIRGRVTIGPPTGRNIVTTVANRYLEGKGLQYYSMDAQSDPNLIRPLTQQEGLVSASDRPAYTFTQKQGVKSFAGLVLVVQGEIVGVLCLNFLSSQEFSNYQRFVIGAFVLEAIDAWTGAALASSRTRENISEDLHDRVKGRLFAIEANARSLLKRIETGSVGESRRGIETVSEVVSKIANITRATQRELLELLGPREDPTASEAISELLEADIREVTAGFEGSLNISGISVLGGRIPSSAIDDWRAIICEALANAVRHSTATSIDVEFEVGGDGVYATIRDNGIGFSPDPSGGRGLQNMERRAKRIRAELRYEPTSGVGTIVRLRL